MGNSLTDWELVICSRRTLSKSVRKSVRFLLGYEACWFSDSSCCSLGFMVSISKLTKLPTLWISQPTVCSVSNCSIVKPNCDWQSSHLKQLCTAGLFLKLSWWNHTKGLWRSIFYELDLSNILSILIHQVDEYFPESFIGLSSWYRVQIRCTK